MVIQAQKLSEEAHTMGSLQCTRVSAELKTARSIDSEADRNSGNVAGTEVDIISLLYKVFWQMESFRVNFCHRFRDDTHCFL